MKIIKDDSWMESSNDLIVIGDDDDDDDESKGSAITADFEDLLKKSSEQAYIFNGNDIWKNIAFIKDKITEQYPGNWLISIFYPSTQTEVKR